MAYYLVPTTFTGDRVPIGYKLVAKEKDTESEWCEANKEHEIKNVVNLLFLCHKYLVKITENRFILPDGKIAYRFAEALYRMEG